MLKIFNTLTNKLETFEPRDPNKVGMYTCGPTVYSYVTIGNWRTYTLADIVSRTLKFLEYNVTHVMNITDVGHLTGDNEGDSSTGEDRMEKAEKKEGKTAWEIAEFYSEDFIKGLKKLNIIRPNVLPKATQHIEEQVKLIEQIEKKGYTYKTSDGIYFDTVKYEDDGNTYGELSNLDQIKEGARVAINPEKKDARDFALWKFSPKNKKRHMEWNSPWGVGFPGWHIECSAMSTKYLGDQFDIHLGGEDLRSTHHPCEIAQTEAATNKKPFVKYWIHGAFLQIDGGRMGKSLGNAYTLQDIVEKGYEALDLRYFYLTGHYKKKLNFTWESLEAAKTAREKLVNRLREIKNNLSEQQNNDFDVEFINKFTEAIEDDFNMPNALALIWEVLKSNMSENKKLVTILKFDTVLGLNLENETFKTDPHTIDSNSDLSYLDEYVKSLVEQRSLARKNKDYKKADQIRDKLREQYGFEIRD